MGLQVVEYSPQWPQQFERVRAELVDALRDVEVVAIEHVGSTSVPGLAAKPVLDIDVIVEREQVGAAVAALERVGYGSRGDLGLADRLAFDAPDDGLARHVYVCVVDTLHVRNHLAVRDVLRRRDDLRDRYGEVKMELAADPQIDIVRYLAGKSAVLQDVLAEADFTDGELATIFGLNTNPQ